MSSVTDRNKETIIKNFTEGQVLAVQAGKAKVAVRGEIPATVCLIGEGGSMRFQFSMLPRQARELAAALVEFAHEIDGGAA